MQSVNKLLQGDGLVLRPVGEMSGQPVYQVGPLLDGVAGAAKNIIFAADGPKPEIVIPDAINNDIRITRNAEHCLVYDRPLDGGLTWNDLVRWWADHRGQDHNDIETKRSLYRRLKGSLQSDPERFLFDAYFKSLRDPLGAKLPALIPQVYLHYDPYTLAQFGAKRLPRQRMDFLILFSVFERVVLEVDGQQHYSEGEKASPRLYAEMVAADRELRLAGYEVYRFGSFELHEQRPDRWAVVQRFLEDLILKHAASLQAPRLRAGFLPTRTDT